ncbi:hypothetical protein, partial [Nitratifractor sp.]|uniref:hypothetical protein n=1 Tax=Nitratifractor sp. TaxID=2268144 RepID=UPI0025DAA6FB
KEAAPATQQPRAAIHEVSNSVVAAYPKLIRMGLKGPDCMHFVKWAGITNDNIDEFMMDLGGVQGLIEQFYEEAGDVTP